MSNDSSIIPRSSRQRTPISYLFLNVTYDGTFWTLGYWENVADCESGFFTAVDEGTGVETFGRYECFFAEFVAVGVAEDDTSEGRTAN